MPAVAAAWKLASRVGRSLFCFSRRGVGVERAVLFALATHAFMKIAVLADTHDKLPQQIVEAIRGADEIWHLGDVTIPAIVERLHGLGRPLRVVRGNCDDFRGWPHALDFELAGWRIRLIHVPPAGPQAEIDLLLHGHTHVPRNEVLGRTRFLNPGCITRPNRGAPASYAWLELNPNVPPGWSIVRV